MQKVRRSKKEIEDALLPLKPYDWVFTEEEKKDIENNLPGYDPEFVKSFISDLEIVCALAKDIRENPTRSEFRNDNQRLANKLTDTLNVLTAFRNTKVPLYLPRHIDSIQSDELFHCFDLSTRASSLAAQAIQPLNELIQLVGQCISTHTNLQSGRPSADATG